MKMGRSLVLGIAGSVMIASGAMAAGVAPLVVAAPPPPPMAAPSFDWNGFYVGIYGGAWGTFDSFELDYARTGLLFGRNLQMGRGVLGIEATAGIYGSNYWEIAVNARGGFLLTDRILIFGLVGYSLDEDYDGLNLGGGLEVGLEENISLRVDAHLWFERGNGGVDPEIAINIGVNWHPGN